ncbi:DUF3375 family protein [Micromonospora craniellae]|uniref:DUF3375 family protein n=1 Tax=Micromonospora craniellae TaxID=2294034 RepID=A0A372FQV5_9ACTN|nr:DUF3375 family protein [Micromonospora craniellae]RFS40470.1 DUF3375 family protein [Micromonospora craniellae]
MMDILRSVEIHALALRDHPTGDLGYEIDGVAPHVVLPMERPLYQIRAKQVLDSGSDADAAPPEVDVSALFEQVHVDPTRLREAVRAALSGGTQVSLPELLAKHPLEQGLAELVTYLSLDRDLTFELVFDERRQEHVRWHDADGRQREAILPAVAFVRRSLPGGE